MLQCVSEFQGGGYYTWVASVKAATIDGVWASTAKTTQVLGHSTPSPQLVVVPSVNHSEIVLPEPPVSTTQKVAKPALAGLKASSPGWEGFWEIDFTVPMGLAKLLSYPGVVTARFTLTVNVDDHFAPDERGAKLTLDVSQWLTSALVTSAIFSRPRNKLIATVIAAGSYVFQGVAPSFKIWLDWRGWSELMLDQRLGFYVAVDVVYSGSFFDIAWPGEGGDSESLSLDGLCEFPTSDEDSESHKPDEGDP